LERFNRTIVNSLRSYLSGRQGDWDEYTASITFGYKCRIHSSLALASFELVLSRPPSPLAVEVPESGNGDTPETVKLMFLQQLLEPMLLVRERLAEVQGRYKRNYDRTVRPKNDDIPKDAWVYVSKGVHAAGTNPKLDEQVEGPFNVSLKDFNTLLLRIGDEIARANLNRITPAPTPLVSANDEHSSPVEWKKIQNTYNGPVEEPEYAIERFFGARQQRDRSILYNIRWFGYGEEDDIWEPENHLHKGLLLKCHRKTELPRAKIFTKVC
jgi:hypothetical protein